MCVYNGIDEGFIFWWVTWWNAAFFGPGDNLGAVYKSVPEQGTNETLMLAILLPLRIRCLSAQRSTLALEGPFRNKCRPTSIPSSEVQVRAPAL